MPWYWWYYVIVAGVIIVAGLVIFFRDGIRNKKACNKQGIGYAVSIIQRSEIIFLICLGLFWPVLIVAAIVLAIVFSLFFKESGRVV